MRQALALAMTVVLATSISEASIILDDFSIDQVSDGTPVAATGGVFGTRVMTDSSGTAAPQNLDTSSGVLSARLIPGDTATITWSAPTGSFTFADLEFLGFNDSGVPQPSVSYDVFVGMTNIGSGTVGSNGILQTSQATVGVADTLSVTFSAVGGLGSFTATGIQANPEPMSAGLLALGLFGGVCRHRRRRKQVC